MPKKSTIETVVQTVDSLTNEVSSLTQGLTSLTDTVTSLTVQVGSLAQEMRQGFKEVRSEFKVVRSDIQDVQEAVEFLKDNAVMRSEFEEGMQRLENTIVDHVDHFVQLHKKQEVELVTVAHRIDRHEHTFHKKS